MLINNFILLEKTFNQAIGTAMGKKVAYPYVDLSTGLLEEQNVISCWIEAFFKYNRTLIKNYFKDTWTTVFYIGILHRIIF